MAPRVLNGETLAGVCLGAAAVLTRDEFIGGMTRGYVGFSVRNMPRGFEWGMLCQFVVYFWQKCCGVVFVFSLPKINNSIIT